MERNMVSVVPANQSSRPPWVIRGWVHALNADAMLPVTLRHVQSDLRTSADGKVGSGSVRVTRIESDGDMRHFGVRQQQHHTADKSERGADFQTVLSLLRRCTEVRAEEFVGAVNKMNFH